METNDTGKRSMLSAILKGRCPACREGRFLTTKNPYDLKNLGKYHKNCPSCGQRFMLEPGFYFGAAYVSYALNVALMVACAVAVYVLVEVPDPMDYILTILAMTLLMFPFIFRASRIIWATMFIPFGGENKQFERPE